jgi:hypothetical protein
MYELNFKDPTDIRMSSPYNVAKVDLKGNFVPDFPKDSFQDKGVISHDRKTCYLIQWVVIKNSPGFRVWRINEDEESVLKSDYFEGCCRDINIFNENAGVILKVRKYNSELQSGEVSDVIVKDFYLRD